MFHITFVKMRIKSFVFLFILFFISGLNAQYVRIGEGSYLSNIGGPFTASTNLAKYHSRFAYIYNKATLGNLKNGDSISSLEFKRSLGVAPNTSCNVRIYLANTSLYDFGSTTVLWSQIISGATLVYNQNPVDLDTAEGFHTFPLSTSFVFDSTKGENLAMFVEYSQTAIQGGNIYFYFESAATVSGLATNQTKYWRDTVLRDSLKSSSEYHPTLIINYPRKNIDLAMLGVYTLGKIPVPLGNPDSVKVLLRNVGKKDVSNANINTWMKGFNTGLDSVKVSLKKGQQQFFNIPSLHPTKKGLDTVYAAISSDQNRVNDTAFSFRFNNENVYSYRDVTQSPAPGGIGFNGTNGDFVARFYSNKTKSLNQVSVAFAITGRPFKIGIWEQSKYGVYPGKLIFLSDSLSSTAGTYILDLKKPVSVNGAFFVGVRQLGTNNVAFGYQVEDPVRPSTFFFAEPVGDTTWIDFAPDAPFRFIIEPRMQGDTDLTVLSADYPKDTLNKYLLDTLAPKATVSNIGAKDMKDSFDITCEVNFYGKVVYKEIMRDTMSSGQKRTYTFPKKFFPKDFGEHELLVYTSHPKDQIIDNDTARRKFYVGVKNDVMVATVYEPSNNATFEYLLDTFMPVATVQNPSYNNSLSINARCVIYKGKTVVYNQNQVLTLPKFNSKILAWPTYKCTDTGKLIVEFTTTMLGDAYKANDTLRRTVYVSKAYDLGFDSIYIPVKNNFYSPGAGIKPMFHIYNDGILDATDVQVTYKITSAYDNNTYVDTIKVNVDAKKSYLGQFPKTVKLQKKGLYTVAMTCSFAGDRVPGNDFISQNFHVGLPYDYQGISVLYPKPTDTIAVGSGTLAPKMRIKNNGYLKTADLCPVILQIWRGNQKLYQDIKSLNLDTGLAFDLDFAKTFTPLLAGQHKIIAYTNYASDVSRNNDSVTGSFYVTVGRDAFVSAIDTPSATTMYHSRESIIPIKATITNEGRLSMNPVRTSAEIYFQNTRVHFESVDDSLLAFESKAIVFQKTFVPQQAGLYRLLVYTFSQNDQNIQNDSLETVFEVDKPNDIENSQWLVPATGSVILNTVGNIFPLNVISQKGANTGTLISGKVDYFIYNATSAEIYADSGDFANLKYNDTLQVMAHSPWSFAIPGFYTAKSIVRSADLFPENDTLFSAFEIRLNSVNKVQSHILQLYPNPASTEIHIVGTKPLKNVVFYNSIGSVVVLKKSENGDGFNIENLTPGVYYAVAEAENARYILTFIKE